MRGSGDNAATIPVVDFRRQSMVLQWHALGGTWTACDTPPAAGARHCVDPRHAAQYLRLWTRRHACGCRSARTNMRWRKIRRESAARAAWQASAFAGASPSRSSTGGMLFSHSYWTNQAQDFFRWLADQRRRSRIGASPADGNGPRVPFGGAAARTRSAASGRRVRIGRQMTPLPGTQGSQVNIHDAHALQALRLVAERRTHAADLAIQSLSENHAKRLRDRCRVTLLGLVTSPMILTPLGHHAQRKIGDGAIHRSPRIPFHDYFPTAKFR